MDLATTGLGCGAGVGVGVAAAAGAVEALTGAAAGLAGFAGFAAGACGGFAGAAVVFFCGGACAAGVCPAAGCMEGIPQIRNKRIFCFTAAIPDLECERAGKTIEKSIFQDSVL